MCGLRNVGAAAVAIAASIAGCVGFESGMVGGLIEIDPFQHRVPRRDHQPGPAFAEPAPAEDILKGTAQRLRRMLRDEEMRHAA
jgi:hypothetical protein